MPACVFARVLAVLAALVVAPAAGLAAEPTFPPGSRIGLVPPPDLTVAPGFPGFQNVEHRTAIVLAELPAEAFLKLEKGVFTETLNQQDVTIERREVLPLATGMAFLITARQEIEGVPHRKWFVLGNNPEFTLFVTVQRPESASAAYPDDVVRAALRTVTVRTVPPEEQLAQLPFRVTDRAGFPHVKTLVRGAAVLLSDGTEGISERPEQPYLVVSVAPGAPPQTSDRGLFAQRMLGGIQGYSDLRVVSSEPMRIGGMPGYEVRAEGKHAQTGTEIALVQWLRFGPGGFMRLVGIAQKQDWPQAFTRFRSVRDGIEAR